MSDPTTTLLTGEESPPATTLLTGEEHDVQYLDQSTYSFEPLLPGATTAATGEEEPPPTTLLTGEESSTFGVTTIDNPFGRF